MNIDQIAKESLDTILKSGSDQAFKDRFLVNLKQVSKGNDKSSLEDAFCNMISCAYVEAIKTNHEITVLMLKKIFEEKNK